MACFTNHKCIQVDHAYYVTFPCLDIAITNKRILDHLEKHGKHPMEGSQATNTSPQPDQVRKLTWVTGKKPCSS
jgi:hypothetical protein